MIDIPPALYIQQRYFSSQFPERKVFKYRHFDSFKEIREEFEQSSILFLLPHQLEKLPPGTIDGCLAIDCLHEMSFDQVRWYFKEVDRVVKDFFYFKCWKDNNGHGWGDNVQLGWNTYPVNPRWEKIYSRTCQIHVKYFEGLYDLKK